MTENPPPPNDDLRVQDIEGDFETGFPTIRQFTLLLENRSGQLIDVIRRFAQTDIHIVSLNAVDSVEYSIVRLVLNPSDAGREVLERAGLAIVESHLIGIELPSAKQPILNVCQALLHANINVTQAFPLHLAGSDEPAVAVLVDDIPLAQKTLSSQNMRMVTEVELANWS